MTSTSEKTFVLSNDTVADNVVYSFAKRGSLRANEMELPGTSAVEVSVLWQNNIVHVGHLDVNQSFAISTTGSVSDPTCFVVDESMMPSGQKELSIVTVRNGQAMFVVAPGCTGEIENNGQNTAFASVAQDGKTHEVALTQGVRAKMNVGSLTVSVRVVARGRKVAGKTKSDRRMLGSAMAAAFAVAGLLTAVELNASNAGVLSAEVQDDQLADLRALVNRTVETQPEPQQVQPTQEQGSHAVETGTSSQLNAPQSPTHSNGGGGNNGHRHGGDNSPRGGHNGNAVTNSAIAWLGNNVDIASFDGAFRNVANGPSRGPGPGDNSGGWPGLNGPGWANNGGPGNNLIPAGDPRGQRDGNGTCLPGYTCHTPRDTGLLQIPGGTHRAPVTPVAGRIEGMDVGLIRRTIQRNRGAIAHCHDQGLQLNPNLSGAVTVAFTIGPDGRVTSSRVASHNLAVPATATCIANAISRITFPQPPTEVGFVSGTYGFTLSPTVQ